MAKFTCTSSNNRNGVTAGRTRVTVYTDFMAVVDRFEIPTRQARKYFKKHPHGEYARRLREADALAKQLEREYQRGQMPLLIA